MFSFADYREIINIIKESGRQATYQEALTRDEFVIMRHDVEYSVERALALSRVEESMDFRSHYFFQWTNNSYNILSRKNRDILREMHERGQHIGLHFALNGMTDMREVRRQILQEIEMLSTMLGFEIRDFSIHRPSPDALAANMKFENILNAYQDEFFSFNPKAAEGVPLEIKYMSDANHIWRYGYPDRENILKNKKVQILTHPFAWTKEGYDTCDNFRTLIDEKFDELVNSVDNECKDFAQFRDMYERRGRSLGKMLEQ